MSDKGNKKLMSSLSRLIKTIVTTKNFTTVMLSRQNGKRVLVKFRNGLQLNLDWSQFFLFRDNYSTIVEFSIKQLNDDLFRITNNNLDYTGNAFSISLILKVKKNCQIQQIDKETFRVKNDKFELVGSYVSSGLLFLICEFLKGDYECNCRDKVVLDVGGFQGETAVFFSLMGAKKIVIYEPVLEHQKLIQTNVSRNQVNAEIHDEGIGEIDEVKTISYETITVGLGLNGTGTKQMYVKIKNASQVIESSGAEIAKFDCEGGEISLVNVPTSILRKVRLYMIEAHGSDIREALIQRFENAGFVLTKDVHGEHCSLLHFERREGL